MKKLLDAVTAISFQLPNDKIQAIASQVRTADTDRASFVLSSIVGSAATMVLVDKLVEAWKSCSVTSDELASMLLASSYSLTRLNAEQTVELVWTGPTTPYISARRTEQAILQVINSANSTLFLTSFVTYDISSIISAMNLAISRGVTISVLLEASQEHGGSLSTDQLEQMRLLVPKANLYVWRYKTNEFVSGKVHAKVAVADGKLCFITSANLTGYAMEKNIEAGVLVSGPVATQLCKHLEALIDTKIVSLL